MYKIPVYSGKHTSSVMEKCKILHEAYVIHLCTCYIMDMLEALGIFMEIECRERQTDDSNFLGPLLLTWFNFNPSMDK